MNLMNVADVGSEEAEAYDGWFDAPWGRYAFGVESRALLDAIGSVGGARVLDAACGTGRFTEVVARSGADVVGLDRDPSMLGVASRRLPHRLVLGDALNMPFPDRTFDASVAVTLCEFVLEPERAVAELARVTRQGGRVVLGALNPASPWGFFHRRRFQRAPWNAARFFSADELLALGAPYGHTTLTSMLYAPGYFPGLTMVGAMLESAGRVAPRLGAFRVLTVVV
jgi:SAM-dependent methyltransferase